MAAAVPRCARAGGQLNKIKPRLLQVRRYQVLRIPCSNEMKTFGVDDVLMSSRILFNIHTLYLLQEPSGTQPGPRSAGSSAQHHTAAQPASAPGTLLYI